MKPTLPLQYWVTKHQLKCVKCNFHFDELIPCENELVKFISTTGEGWLPTYGQGGYLELVARLVPDYVSGQPITMLIAKRFDQKLSESQVFCSPNKDWHVYVKPCCPKCGTTDVSILAEETLTNPVLDCA